MTQVGDLNVFNQKKLHASVLIMKLLTLFS